MNEEKMGDQLIEIQSLLTIDDLEHWLKLHRRTIWRLCTAGHFPQPIKIGSSNRWRQEDIFRLLETPTDKSVTSTNN